MFDQKRAYPLILLCLVLTLITEAVFFIWLALIIVGVLIVRAEFLEPVASVFESVTRFVGTWASNIVLGVIFFVIVVPYGYMYRAVEKQLVKHFFDSSGRASFYTEEKKIYGSEHFEKPW